MMLKDFKIHKQYLTVFLKFWNWKPFLKKSQNCEAMLSFLEKEVPFYDVINFECIFLDYSFFLRIQNICPEDGFLAYMLNIYYYYYYSLIRAFHISVSRWFFTGVWVIASLLKSPGLFSVFWPFSIMLSFGWSPLVRQLPNPPVPLVIL